MLFCNAVVGIGTVKCLLFPQTYTAVKTILIAVNERIYNTSFCHFCEYTFFQFTDPPSVSCLDWPQMCAYICTEVLPSCPTQLQLWDTGGLERVASVTSSYFKFAEAAILVFALDNIDSFNILSQHLLEIVSHAEHAKIYVCGNKTDLKHDVVVSDADIQMFW